MTLRDTAPHLWLCLEEIAVGLRGQHVDDLRTWRVGDPLWVAATYEAMALHLEKLGLRRQADLLRQEAIATYAAGIVPSTAPTGRRSR